MYKRYGFATGVEQYEQPQNKVLENDNVKILLDISVETDHKLEHNKPDIITVDIETGECHTLMQHAHSTLDEREKSIEGRAMPKIKERD